MAATFRIIRGDGSGLCNNGRMRAELLAANGDLLTLKPLRIVGERNEEGRRTVILAEAGDAVPVAELRGRASDDGGNPRGKART
jgi:hypothetical protein